MKKRLFRLGALCCAAAMTITTGAQALSVEEAYDILQRSYVDKLPRAAQDAKSLDELFSYTDDYTYYMTAEEYQAFLQGVEGDVSFAGIGAEITYVPEGISRAAARRRRALPRATSSSPLRASPARRAARSTAPSSSAKRGRA